MSKNQYDQLELPEQSKPLVEKLRSLWMFSKQEMSSKTFITKEDIRLIILIQITNAASKIIHSVLAQIDNDSFYGLDYLSRPLIEALINYKYIKEDSTQMRARAFIVDDIRSRLKNIKRLIPLLENNLAPVMSTVTDANRYKELQEQLEKEQNELVSQYGKDNLNFLDLLERAKRSGTLEIYATAYWLLSEDAHLTARGLDRFMREEGGQLSVTGDMDLNRFEMNLKTFYIVFSALLNECSEQFGIPDKEGLNEFPSKI